jgi:hypothetical protein
MCAKFGANGWIGHSEMLHPTCTALHAPAPVLCMCMSNMAA